MIPQQHAVVAFFLGIILGSALGVCAWIMVSLEMLGRPKKKEKGEQTFMELYEENLEIVERENRREKVKRDKIMRQMQKTRGRIRHTLDELERLL